MKKKVALPVAITAGVVALLLIAVLTLSLIKINPLKSLLGGYERVEVYNTGAAFPYPNTEQSESKLSEGIDGAKFSVMHAILEGRFSYAPKFKTVKNEDGEKERVRLGTNEITSLVSDDTKYMLLFSYDAPKSVKVQGETVTFDRAKIKVFDTAGEIEKIEVVAYSYDKINEVPVDPYYTVDVIEIYTVTTNLFAVLGDYANLIQ